MRRLLALTVLAVATAAVPASAQYLISSCSDGDWQVVEVSSGGSEVIEVCASDDPRDVIVPAIKCYRPVTC